MTDITKKNIVIVEILEKNNVKFVLLCYAKFKTNLIFFPFLIRVVNPIFLTVILKCLILISYILYPLWVLKGKHVCIYVR